MADTNRPSPLVPVLNPSFEERRQRDREKRRNLENFERLGVLDGLSEPQRKKLANRVLFVSAFYDWRAEVRVIEEGLDALFSRRGRLQFKRLGEKVENLREHFEALRACAASIKASENVLLAGVLDDDFQLSVVLEELATAISKLQIPTDAVIDAMRHPRVGVEDPTNPVTGELAKFFAECGVKKNDATQRIAKIGNVLWGWNIPDHDPHSHTPNRSDTIRKRLNRLPPSPSSASR